MPDSERLLTTLRRAADLFRATPGRTGRVVAPAGADDVLVGGDLHGHLGNFQALLKKADLAGRPRRHLVLQEIIHGPHEYPQGGDKSHQLLDLVAALKCQYPERVHFLPGNHELAQATGRPISKSEADSNVLFLQGVRAAYGARADDVYAAYVDLIAAAPLAVRTTNRVFISHSLPSALRMDIFRLDDLLRDSRPEDLDNHGAATPGRRTWPRSWRKWTPTCSSRDISRQRQGSTRPTIAS
jgi:hypothetical protein